MEEDKEIDTQYFVSDVTQDDQDLMYSPSLVRELSPQETVHSFKQSLQSLIDSPFNTFADSSDEQLSKPLAELSMRDVLKLFSKHVNSTVENMNGIVKYTPINHELLVSSLVNLFESAMNYSRNSKLIDAYVKCMNESDQSKQQIMLKNIALEFFEISKTYGELVVKEIPLNGEQKVLKSAQIGGVAGGEKFIARSVLLKLATDKQIVPGRYLYGGTHENIEYAMKVCSLSLTCL
jgi:hypothetical protein